MGVQTVAVDAFPIDRFEPLIGRERTTRFRLEAERARRLLEGRVVWNVNSTATGGGVAEMLQVLLAYARSIGIDTRWLVIEGEPAFFEVTKRLHNHFHGAPGDGGPLAGAERAEYERVLAGNAGELAAMVRPGDVVLLHDPQTAGLCAAMRDAGAIVVWRSHIGLDGANEWTERAWGFVRPYLDAARATVFSRAQYAPPWLDPASVHVIPPSIDPFSPKNQALDPAVAEAIMVQAGLLVPPRDDRLPRPLFTRRDGSAGTVTRRARVVGDDRPPADAPVVVQVSRWDRLKDMGGVMQGFAEHVAPAPGCERAHLLLVGPDVSGVTDDPEGAEVHGECVAQWQALPEGVRQRVHLVSLPMDDVEENAAMVNAIQRHAAVVTQKSLAEGFGLTVAEAMVKARPVVASAVGGILDQITDGETGVLVHVPDGLDEFGGAVRRLLLQPEDARRLGLGARRRVLDQFLGDRHLIQYGALLAPLVLTA